MGELIQMNGQSVGMRPEMDRIKSLGIVVRHAAITVSGDEKNPDAVVSAQLTPQGVEEIHQKLVPYIVGKVKEDPTRTTVLLFHYNKNRDRTTLTAQTAILGTRQAIRAAGFSRLVRVIDAGHADILDTTTPLRTRIKQGDSKDEAAINWILEDEEKQKQKGIEPPSLMYERIARSERETYLGTLFKQPVISRKNERERQKRGARFSHPLLVEKKVTIIHVGVTHNGYHGAILKAVASPEEAVKVGFLEPIEIHPLDRERQLLYSFPDRGSAYILNRSLR